MQAEAQLHYLTTHGMYSVTMTNNDVPIDDRAEDGGKEFFTEMHFVL